MCLAIPMKVIEIEGESAVVEVNGISQKIGLQLVPEIKIDDWVIIHAGFAIAKLNEKEAQETLALFKESGFLG